MRVQFNVFPLAGFNGPEVSFTLVGPADRLIPAARNMADRIAASHGWLDRGVKQIAIVESTEAEIEALADDHAGHVNHQPNCLRCNRCER